MNQKTIKQLCTFVCVGSTGAVINITLVILLVEKGGLLPLVANPFAFIGAFFASYFGHYHFTFKTKKSHKKTLPRFFMSALIGLCINESILSIGIHVFKLHYLWSLLIAIIAAGCCVFLLGKYWSLTHE